MSFWASLAGLVEISNINLSLLKIMLISEWGRGSTFEAVNGVLFWITFFIVRVVGIPVWLYLFAADVRAGVPTSPRGSSPALSFLRVLAPTSQLIMWFICLYWFQKITKGMLKALRGGSVKAE